MFRQLTQWYKYRFDDPNLSVLFLLLLAAILIFYFLGNILVPVFVALVLSYLLDWPINYLVSRKMNRTFATFIVMLLFLSLAIFAFLGVLPTVFKQGAALIKDLPAMFNQIQDYVLTLPVKYPDIIDPVTITQIVVNLRSYVLDSGGFLLTQSFASLLNIAALIIYAVLVPMMMIFMLKDKKTLIASFVKFLPKNRKLADQVWNEMNGQIMNYIRGKLAEILIVGGSTYIIFVVMELRYSALLALLVGLSVLIPYIGAAAVTIPVAVVALLQWGVTADFIYLMVAYGLIQVIDGNLIVPILFSEAVNLHPVIIIMSVLVFGGLWGFWGVFFAIPLATLVKAILNAWPSQGQIEVANS